MQQQAVLNVEIQSLGWSFGGSSLDEVDLAVAFLHFSGQLASGIQVSQLDVAEEVAVGEQRELGNFCAWSFRVCDCPDRFAVETLANRAYGVDDSNYEPFAGRVGVKLESPAEIYSRHGDAAFGDAARDASFRERLAGK